MAFSEGKGCPTFCLMMTDHARWESIKRYTCVQLEAKRRLMERKQERNF
jgi:hypothetical protein